MLPYFTFLSVCLGHLNFFKAYVIIYCGKVKFKGYKMPKKVELKYQQERPTESYKNGT